MRSFSLFLFFISFSLCGYSESIDLYITAGSQGQLEAVNGMGGLETHAGFFEDVVNQATPFIVIEAGGFMPDNMDNPIDQANAEIYSKAMNELPYQVISLSDDDLLIGSEKIKQLQDLIGQEFLMTNIAAENDKTNNDFVDTKIIDVNDVSVGFISLPVLEDAVLINDGEFISSSPNQVSEIIETLKQDEQVDLVVLIAMQSPASVLGWFNAYEGTVPDLIISQNLDIRVQKPNGVWMSNAPANGNSVAKISLQLNEEKQIEKTEFQRIAINSEEYYSDSMRDLLFAQYDEYIDKLDLELSEPYPLMGHELEQNYMSIYAGADRCQECHQDIYEQWAETKHASAFDELLKTNRHWVPEKVVYRVTGYGHSSGYQNFIDTPYLTDVQCETCHGPGQIHIDEFGTGEIRRGKSKELCMECHTQERDPEFEELFDLYYEQIEH